MSDLFRAASYLAILLVLIGAVIAIKSWQYQSCRDTDHLSAGTCTGIISR